MTLFLVVLLGAIACILAGILASQDTSLLSFTTIISCIALLVSMANSYFTFFWDHENLRLYLRFRDPLQVGTDKIDLTYFFTNLGDRAILVEDLAILQFTLNAHSL